MNKDELLKILRHLIVEWIIPIEHEGSPFEHKKYVTLHPAVIPEDEEIVETDDTHIAVYNVVFETYEVLDISDPCAYHIGVNFNGTVDPNFSFGCITNDEEIPDLSKYMDYIQDKLTSFKYRLNTVLNVAEQEWNSSTVYELIDIGKNEFNYDLSKLIAGKDSDKDDMVAELRKIFIRNTMSGYSTLTEHRMKTTTAVLEAIGVDADMIGTSDEKVLDKIRGVWLDIIRKYRDKALAALDKEEELAEKDNDEQGLEEVGFIKQMLRDLPEEIQHLKQLHSPTDIVEFWPPILLPKPKDIDLS